MWSSGVEEVEIDGLQSRWESSGAAVRGARVAGWMGLIRLAYPMAALCSGSADEVPFTWSFFFFFTQTVTFVYKVVSHVGHLTVGNASQCCHHTLELKYGACVRGLRILCVNFFRLRVCLIWGVGGGVQSSSWFVGLMRFVNRWSLGTRLAHGARAGIRRRRRDDNCDDCLLELSSRSLIQRLLTRCGSLSCVFLSRERFLEWRKKLQLWIGLYVCNFHGSSQEGVEQMSTHSKCLTISVQD